MTPSFPKFSIQQDDARINVYHAGIGEGLPRHEHPHSHLTMCHAGSIKVSNERRSLVMTKDTQPVNLRAGEWHEVEVLEDGTVFVNVFAEGKA